MDTFKSLKKHHSARTEARWEVSFITPQGKIAGETVNISSEGAMVSCQELPPLEDDFRMLIKPPNHFPIDITGRVVWTTICNPVSGAETIGVDVQFMSIPERDRLFLQSMIPEQFGGKISETGNKQMVQQEVDAEAEPALPNAPHIAEISLPVFYNRGGKTVKATGSRFSTKGCHLYTKLAPPSSPVFSLELQNPQTGKSIRVDSSVVQRKRCAIKNQWGMILRFMNLSGSDREEIKQILLDASDAVKPEKEPKYIKSKIGQALLKHFSRKRTVH